MRTLTTFLFLVSSFTVIAEDPEELLWPREIVGENGIIVTLYQPQLESFVDTELTGRMALSVKPPDGDLVFGALWFSARISTDLEARTMLLESFDITQTRFPDVEGKQDKIDEFTALLEKEVEGWDLKMSLDRFLASLELVEQNQKFAEQFKNDPPDIYFRTNSAMLIYIDGDPIFKGTGEDGFEYVVNTPYFMVKDIEQKQHYLRGGKWWYSSSSIATGWMPARNVPAKLEELAKQVMELDSLEQDSVIMAMKEPPGLIVTTKPAELIITDGEPDYKPVEGTSLLYVDNTESDIVMDINTQEHYVLLAGRWYHSKTLEDGDWKFEEPGDLPEDFSKIPMDSDIANVRVSVPGTEEASAAVLEQSIPQTAEVDRRTATVEVTYDGEPEFKEIENTDVSYALNSDKTVLLIKDLYYCVDDGIWFESLRANGPWAVSTERPDEVDQIPPEEPVYNVKYVYIYDSTPDVVYVGYTPGYTTSYVYHGVVIYGTGYYYYPWYHTYYYPRPVTYGFSVHYNPWTGWGFSFGVSYGWFSVGWGRPYYGWWGPGGYRYGYRHGYYRGYNHGYRRGYSAGRRAGYRSGYRAGQRPASRNNVYRNRSNGVGSTGIARGSNTRNRTTQARPSSKSNNMYAGKNGNVYRRDQGGNVRQRSNGQWNSSNRSQQNQQINRQHQSRQQGSRNYNNYSRSRSTGSRPSGGRSGGRRR